MTPWQKGKDTSVIRVQMYEHWERFFLYGGLCRVLWPELVPESVDTALAPLDTQEWKVFRDVSAVD